MTNCLALTFKNNKIHIRRKPAVKQSAGLLKKLIKPEKLVGMSVRIKGRIKGMARARKIKITKGAVKANTLAYPLHTKQQPSQTKWGKLGLWLSLGTR